MIKKLVDYIAFSGLTAGIGFFTVIYMTKHMPIEDFGVVGIFMAVLYVLPQLISFSSVGLVSINKVKLQKKEFLLFSKSYFTFAMIVFSLVCLFSFLTSFFFSQYTLLFIIVPLIAFIQYFSMFHNAELIQDGKSRIFGSYRLILSIISLLLTMLFLTQFHLTWEGRAYAMLLSESVILLLSVYFSFTTLKNYKFSFDLDAYREYFYFGLPLLFGLGAGWLLNQADRFIVLHFFDLKSVGLYTLAYTIGTLLNIINQAATNTIIPYVYKELERKKGHIIIRKLNIYYSLSIVCFALIVGFSSFWYVPLLFEPLYSDAPKIILFISLGFSFNGIYRVTGSVIAFYKKNQLQAKILYASAILNIILSIIFIPFFGILSPAIGTFMAYILLATLSYSYGWKILQQEEKYESNF